MKINVTEVVRKFNDQYEDFNSNWVQRDESKNYMQEHDEELAMQEVMP